MRDLIVTDATRTLANIGRSELNAPQSGAAQMAQGWGARLDASHQRLSSSDIDAIAQRIFSAKNGRLQNFSSRLEAREQRSSSTNPQVAFYVKEWEGVHPNHPGRVRSEAENPRTYKVLGNCQYSKALGPQLTVSGIEEVRVADPSAEYLTYEEMARLTTALEILEEESLIASAVSAGGQSKAKLTLNSARINAIAITYMIEKGIMGLQGEERIQSVGVQEALRHMRPTSLQRSSSMIHELMQIISDNSRSSLGASASALDSSETSQFLSKLSQELSETNLGGGGDNSRMGVPTLIDYRAAKESAIRATSADYRYQTAMQVVVSQLRDNLSNIQQQMQSQNAYVQNLTSRVQTLELDKRELASRLEQADKAQGDKIKQITELSLTEAHEGKMKLMEEIDELSRYREMYVALQSRYQQLEEQSRGLEREKMQYLRTIDENNQSLRHCQTEIESLREADRLTREEYEELRTEKDSLEEQLNNSRKSFFGW